jgi:uncharacterized membrane protein
MAFWPGSKKAYQAGFRDGYDHAVTKMQRKIDKLVDQFRKGNRADLDALRAEIAAARAELARTRAIDDTNEAEPDATKRLN